MNPISRGADWDFELLERYDEAIVMAISDRDDQAARNAMREHLVGSQARYRNLLKDLRSFTS